MSVLGALAAALCIGGGVFALTSHVLPYSGWTGDNGREGGEQQLAAAAPVGGAAVSRPRAPGAAAIPGGALVGVPAAPAGPAAAAAPAAAAPAPRPPPPPAPAPPARGELFRTVERIDALLLRHGADRFKLRGQIAMKAGFALDLADPDAPDDPEQLKRLHAAAAAVLGARL
jgi:hypothetical protein